MQDFIRSPITIAAIALTVILVAVIAIVSWIDSIPDEVPVTKIVLCNGTPLTRVVSPAYLKEGWIIWDEGETKIMVQVTHCKRIRVVPDTDSGY